MAYDKVIDSAQLDADLLSVADAIRAKGGTSEQMSFPDGFVSAVEGIQAGGGDSYEAARRILDMSITEYNDSELNTIKIAAFRDNKTLVTVNLPKATDVINYTFYGCTSLVTCNLPSMKTLYSRNNMFQNCTSLKNVDVSSVICVGGGFFGCTSLEEISFPSIGTSNVAGSGGFYSGVFSGCTSLKKVDLGAPAPFLRTQTFLNCSSFNTLIIRGNGVSSLSNTNNFDGTPFASGGSGGTVYVPSALIESYQTATNWSTLYAAGTCNFVAIEGSEYE